MATNFIAQGDVIQATNGTGTAIVSGQPMAIGAGCTGFCLEDIANGGTGSVQLKGIFDYPVKGHDGSSNAAVSVGDKVYYTAGEAFFDKDSSAVPAGIALEAVSSGSTTTVEVLLATF